MDALDGFLEKLVRDEIKKFEIKDNITRFLVKKKRRGTYQAFEESTLTEQDITESTVQYIKEWIQGEFMDGNLSKLLKREVRNQALMELSSKGLIGIIK